MDSFFVRPLAVLSSPTQCDRVRPFQLVNGNIKKKGLCLPSNGFFKFRTCTQDRLIVFRFEALQTTSCDVPFKSKNLAKSYFSLSDSLFLMKSRLEGYSLDLIFRRVEANYRNKKGVYEEP